ncbi:uncharacterized protein [Centruroides vittatus]|uniref:uncharacterized protein n=1 Tax=Centruroides vittatus TaxID=120091 RepID=UPI00350F26B5
MFLLSKVIFIIGCNLIFIETTSTTFNQTFIERMKSSCPLISHATKNTLNDNLKENIFQEIKIRVENLQNVMNKILILNILDACSSLNIVLINFVQNFNHSYSDLIQNLSSPSLALQYISFLAYASNIYYLNQSYEELLYLNYPYDSKNDNETSLINFLSRISALILDVTCLFHLATSFNIRLNFDELTYPILNLNFELPNSTSLKQIKVCQIVKSTLNFLAQFNVYLTENWL